ncbi:PspA/IM30 family protein [Rhodococcus phenolicus]|uniref:PspA/IM30 family protein n=1 Tax=Rhodococcus phenolicus TaxID=263849 RepID=UPI0008301030|nr:hypothetical protein [Rhodococcus phenolicus]
MTTDPSEPDRAPEPERPDRPVPDVTPAEPTSPTVPDVPPGPDIPDVTPADPEPEIEPGPVVPDVTPAEGVRAPTIEEITGYTEGGVPTFDSVRDKIEKRLGTAMGAEELARETEPARTLDEEFEDRKKAAADKLAEIRRSVSS